MQIKAAKKSKTFNTRGHHADIARQSMCAHTLMHVHVGWSEGVLA